MLKIRKNIFETNSSSSHSLVICDKETWDKFLDGKLIFNVLHESNGYPAFCTWKEVKHYIKNRIKEIPYPDNWRDMNKQEMERYRNLKRKHALDFFEQTFYTVDELDKVSYNEETQEASLVYYFG